MSFKQIYDSRYVREKFQMCMIIEKPCTDLSCQHLFFYFFMCLHKTFASALELNSVWAGCLVTPLVQDGQQITKLNLSVAVDVGAAGHLGGGDDEPLAVTRLLRAAKAWDALGFNSAIRPGSNHCKVR